MTELYPSAATSSFGTGPNYICDNEIYYDYEYEVNVKFYQCDFILDGDYDTLPVIKRNDTVSSESPVEAESYNGTGNSNVKRVAANSFSESNLIIIKLSDFNVTQIEKGAFATNKMTLNELYLHNLNLEVINASFFSQANNLKLLSVRGNQITVLRDYTFISLSKLRRLYIEEPLKVVEPQTLAGLFSIRITVYNMDRAVEGLPYILRNVEEFHITYNEGDYAQMPPHQVFKTVWLFSEDLNPQQIPAFTHLIVTRVNSNLHLVLHDLKVDKYDTFKQGVKILEILHVPQRVLYSCMFDGFDTLTSLSLQGTSTQLIQVGAFVGLLKVENIAIILGHQLWGLGYKTLRPVLNTLKTINLNSTYIECGCTGMWIKYFTGTSLVKNADFCFKEIADNDNKVGCPTGKENGNHNSKFELHPIDQHHFPVKKCKMEELFGGTETPELQQVCQNNTNGNETHDSGDDESGRYCKNGGNKQSVHHHWMILFAFIATFTFYI